MNPPFWIYGCAAYRKSTFLLLSLNLKKISLIRRSVLHLSEGNQIQDAQV
jgi:hypothetical protein